MLRIPISHVSSINLRRPGLGGRHAPAWSPPPATCPSMLSTFASSHAITMCSPLLPFCIRPHLGNLRGLCLVQNLTQASWHHLDPSTTPVTHSACPSLKATLRKELQTAHPSPPTPPWTAALEQKMLFLCLLAYCLFSLLSKCEFLEAVSGGVSALLFVELMSRRKQHFLTLSK